MQTLFGLAVGVFKLWFIAVMSLALFGLIFSVLVGLAELCDTEERGRKAYRRQCEKWAKEDIKNAGKTDTPCRSAFYVWAKRLRSMPRILGEQGYRAESDANNR